MNLTIKLTDITIDEALKDVDFRWGLYNADTGNGLSFGIFKYTTTEELLYTDTIIDAADPDITKNYILRIWLHDDGALQNEFMGKTFSGKVTVTGEAIEYTPESCFDFDSSTGTIVNTDEDWTAYDTSCGTDLVIPRTINGVEIKYLNLEVFTMVTEISSIIIPDSVSEVVSGPPEYVPNISHITIPESVTLMNGSPFGLPTYSSFIPDTTVFEGTGFPGNKVLVLGSKALSGSGGLFKFAEELIIMDGVDSIGLASLYLDITSIEIPSSVTKVGEVAFEGCTNLTEIVVRGKTSLDDFEDATGLTTDGGLPEGVNIIFRP